LLVAHIPPVCSLLAPCERGASRQEGDQFISLRTLSLLLVLATSGTALAQEPPTIFDPVHGEISPGTAAPSRAELMDVIRSGAPGQLMTSLEYGEMVACNECVPLLEHKLLNSDEPEVREFSAWWLRRQPFAVGAIMNRMRLTLAGDADPVRRARAAEALGELMDAHGLLPLRRAVEGDTDGGADTSPVVRAAAVRALGRLNHPAGNAVIAHAIEDADPSVRRAALSVVLIVNFYRDYDALVSALADDDGDVRRRAAQLVGEFRVESAVPALEALLTADDVPGVREAAAWALGRVGGADAQRALTAAMGTEGESLVRDAIEVGLRMRH